MDSAEYDRLAEQFERETGLMAPGKDKPAALAGIGGTRKERRDAWDDWLNERDPTTEGGGEDSE